MMPITVNKVQSTNISAFGFYEILSYSLTQWEVFSNAKHFKNPNHGLNYLDNPHLLNDSPSFRIQGFGIGLHVILSYQVRVSE